MEWTRRRGLELCIIGFLTILLAPPTETAAQGLRGSAASLDRQNEQARLHDFTYLNTPADVRRFVEAGYLVPVRPNQDYDVHNVSFPYARPEARLFIQRLAAQYRAACGEKLVVTSLTRPRNRQPPNASSRSVHPTGMAIDLRVSQNARCRSWLESTLLSLEGQGVLEAIRERRPPHYHVALYPRPYSEHVARVTGEARTAEVAGSSGTEVRSELVQHRVRRGENLTAIARRYDTSVSRLRAENGLSTSRILAGQVLQVPVYREVTASEAVTRVSSNVSESDGPGEALEHTVGRGESLWTLARRYGTTVSALQQENALNSTRIVVGQNLVIPAESTAGRVAQFVRHTVQSGESLWTIARRHGTTVNRIQDQNDISSNRIYAGQVLSVPAGR